MNGYWRSAYQKKRNNGWQWLTWCLILLITLFFFFQNLRIYLRKIEYEKDLADVQEEISSLENKKRQLDFQTESTNHEIFLERLARARLNLMKPGEQVIVFEVKGESPDYLTDQEELGFWSKTISNIKQWFKRQ